MTDRRKSRRGDIPERASRSAPQPPRTRLRLSNGFITPQTPTLPPRRTRQQTLTQIDFVTVLTPQEDVDLEYLEDDRLRERKRRHTVQDADSTSKRRRSVRWMETAEMISDAPEAPASRTPRIKTELPETPKKPRQGEIPSSQSPLQGLSPVKREPARSPLGEMSRNRRHRQQLESGAKRRVRRSPRLKDNHSWGSEDKHTPYPSSVYQALDPAPPASRVSRTHVQRHSPSPKSPSNCRQLPLGAVIKDSEDESNGEDDEVLPDDYTFGPETQAVFDVLSFTSDDLRLQDELLQPLQTESSAQPSDLKPPERSSDPIKQETHCSQDRPFHKTRNPPLSDIKQSDSPSDPLKQEAHSSQDQASLQLSTTLHQSTASLPPPPSSSNSLSTRFSQATTAWPSSDLAEQKTPPTPQSYLPTPSARREREEGFDWKRLTESQLLPASLMESFLPMPPSLPLTDTQTQSQGSGDEETTDGD